MNYKKKGLQELLRLVCEGGCSKIVVNYKDRLVRFGYELIETVCEEHNVDIEIINQTDDISYEEELTEDVLAIITMFSAKLYGKRSSPQ
ncbi:resolvase, N-terminal domain protein [Lactobacillus delbrueckii subsp. lactis CRL581]|nr:resolvase, N-terminal domain protein [Lactobacillus delbrueckii subsp. lactis CRL581]